MPRRRMSSVKLISEPSRRWIGLGATKVPAPRRRCTSPSAARFCTAWRAVMRLTR